MGFDHIAPANRDFLVSLDGAPLERDFSGSGAVAGVI